MPQFSLRPDALERSRLRTELGWFSIPALTVAIGAALLLAASYAAEFSTALSVLGWAHIVIGAGLTVRSLILSPKTES